MDCSFNSPNGYLDYTSRLMEQNFGHTLDLEKFLQVTPHVITRCPAGYVRQWSSEQAINDAGSVIAVERDKFIAKLDVQYFDPDEISVKVMNKNVVTIEGEHEEKRDDHGTIYRHFLRRYVIPEGYNADNVESQLSSDGLLLIVVPKAKEIDAEYKEIPVVYTGNPAKVNQNKNMENEQ